MSVIDYLLTKNQAYQAFGLIVIKYLHKKDLINRLDIEFNSSINKELNVTEKELSSLCDHLSILYRSEIKAPAIVSDMTIKELLDNMYNALKKRNNRER